MSKLPAFAQVNLQTAAWRTEPARHAPQQYWDARHDMAITNVGGAFPWQAALFGIIAAYCTDETTAWAVLHKLARDLSGT
jgi:hypothetical protein